MLNYYKSHSNLMVTCAVTSRSYKDIIKIYIYIYIYIHTTMENKAVKTITDPLKNM